uniref:Mitochondrial import inner membrane translocase subunit TIM50 n=1 Tax=Oryza punctata TaxID=4537 RepID=A0A0E0L3L1_ORYPU
MAAAEFLSPETAAGVGVGAVRQQQQHPGQAAWRVVVGWLGFLLQILLQIVRGTPSSWAHLLSFLGLRHPLLSAAPAQPSPSVAFVRLPSEVPADESSTGTPPTPLRRLTVVLDLDETLVCAYESSSLPAVLRAEAIEAGLHCFDMECISAEKASKLCHPFLIDIPLKPRKLLIRGCIFLDIKDAEGRHRVNRVTVFERPGLHEFLQRTSEFADLILFTAGLEGYAKPLVDRIDAHNRFCHRLYRPSTVTTEYREHVKDLSCLSKDFHRIVIVDNNPYSFLLQPLNGIPCLTFSAGQPVDDQADIHSRPKILCPYNLAECS